MASLKQAIDAADGSVSVSVADLNSGKSFSYGATSHSFVTASIVKMDILATLLLQAQEQGSSLSSGQRALAVQMIENSDNTAASDLYSAIGGASGLNTANKHFGLTSTCGGPGGVWGVTTTNSADQLRLLRQVFSSSSVLDGASRSYLQSLMEQVETDQQWGVSAASTGGGFALKNGWLPRSTSGLWVINSVGRVTYEGHTLLISVLSDGNSSEAGGIALVESVAKAAAEALS